MRIFWDGGICLQDGIREIVLDPRRTTPGSVVSHAHLDHLTKGALMTPETLAVMKVRLGKSEGKPLLIGAVTKYHGFELGFHDAGHTFGSAMIEVGDVLYTGDFNPEGGLTCGIAVPHKCDTLIIESTYGKPDYLFAPKREVERDLLSWTESELAEHPVAFGAVEFGKAQELIALINSIGLEAAVSEGIAAIADVYKAHGVKLRFRRLTQLDKEERAEPRVYIVPRSWLGPDAPECFSFFKGNEGTQALVSGWCAIFNFSKSRDIKAQFPLSDHADFNDLMDFVAACEPRFVYTVGNNSRELAKEIEKKHRIRAASLRGGRRRKGGISH